MSNGTHNQIPIWDKVSDASLQEDEVSVIKVHCAEKAHTDADGHSEHCGTIDVASPIGGSRHVHESEFLVPSVWVHVYA